MKRKHPIRLSLVIFAALTLLISCQNSQSPAGNKVGSSSTSTTVSTSTTPDNASNDDGAGGFESNGNVGELNLVLTPVASLAAPMALAALPGEKVMYVAERGGTIRLAELTSTGIEVGEVLLQVATTTDSERGLLGLAISPNGREIYVSYTNTGGNSVVEEYQLANNRVDPSTKRQIFYTEQPYSNHNGGHLAFGPDGALYLGLGDGGSGGDPHENAQDPNEVLGSMLRFELPDATPEIWAIGLRNPWRFAWDFTTGDLWIADVGQNAFEEISVYNDDMLPTPRLPEAPIPNFGWPIFEGNEAYGDGPEPLAYIPPVHTYGHNQGCSIVGGYVYRGHQIPELQGAYLYSDYCEPSLWALIGNLDDGFEAVSLGLEVPGGQVASFGEGPDGEIYVMSLAGGLYRLDAI